MTLHEALERIKNSESVQRKGDLEESARICDDLQALVDSYDEWHFAQEEWQSLKSHMQLQRGNIAWNRGDLTLALNHYQQALDQSESSSLADVKIASLCNIGLIHSRLQNTPNARLFLEQALELAYSTHNKLYAANIQCNLGGLHQSATETEQAIERYEKSIALYREIGDRAGEALVLTSIGQLHFLNGKQDDGLQNILLSLAIAEDVGDKDRTILNLESIGQMYLTEDFDKHDYAKSEEYLLRALQLSKEFGSRECLSSVHYTLANLYKLQALWEKALLHTEKGFEYEREMTTIEAKRLSDKIGYERQAALREKEFEVERATTRATQSLLHRVLPSTIAQRIIEGEEEIADYLPNVSILFADIKGFTSISEHMPAFIVVRFRGSVFGAFDEIMRRNGCEKIKTIGDGYFAVAGAPTQCEDHAERLVQAAFEMLESIHVAEEFEEYFPSESKLGVRIGLHTGPVVAGVVGSDKFVYDIYSDAVNTASRMESHGEVNRIHVSAEFARHLQNRFAMMKNSTHGISFVKRGEIEIKGKGLMRTFFLEKA